MQEALEESKARKFYLYSGHDYTGIVDLFRARKNKIVICEVVEEKNFLGSEGGTFELIELRGVRFQKSSKEIGCSAHSMVLFEDEGSFAVLTSSGWDRITVEWFRCCGELPAYVRFGGTKKSHARIRFKGLESSQCISSGKLFGRLGLRSIARVTVGSNGVHLLQLCPSWQPSTQATAIGAHTPPWFSWSYWKLLVQKTRIMPWGCSTKGKNVLSRTAAGLHVRWLSSVSTSGPLYLNTRIQIAKWPIRSYGICQAHRVLGQLKFSFKGIKHDYVLTSSESRRGPRPNTRFPVSLMVLRDCARQFCSIFSEISQ